MSVESRFEVAGTGLEQEAELLVDADSDVTPVLSIVMPTLDEEEGIATCIERAKNAIADLGVPAEIIVSDSSTDRTPEIAREKGAIVVEPDEPGYGYAYRYAFERARGDYVAMGDADATYDFEELPALVELVEGGADIALGSRLTGEIEPGAMPPLHRYVGNPLLTLFLNLFYDAGVSDAHSGFRVLRREALDELELATDGMEFASEMIMEAAAAGLTIEETPITYSDRAGEATLESFRDGWRHVKFMLINAPTYLFTLPAAGFAALGALVMVGSILGQQVAGLTFGVHTVIAGSLLSIVGVQIGSLSIFSAVAGDPIKTPEDPVVRWVRANFRLEHGVVLGLGLLSFGASYVSVMLVRWVVSGFTQIPFVVWNVVAFTALVIGVQVVFQSFFLSLIGGPFE